MEEKYRALFLELEKELLEVKRAYEKSEDVYSVEAPSPNYATFTTSPEVLRMFFSEKMCSSLKKSVLVAEDILALLKEDRDRVRGRKSFPEWYKKNVEKYKITLEKLRLTAEFVLSNKNFKRFVSDDVIKEIKNGVLDLLKESKNYFKTVTDKNESLFFLKEI